LAHATERAGAGAIGDIGSHLVDLARFLIGDIARVLARSLTVITKRRVPGTGAYGDVDVDDLTDVVLEFQGGETGLLEVNWTATGSKTDISFSVLGDKGALRFTWTRPMELQYYSRTDAAHTQGFRTIILGPAHDGASLFWPVAGHGLGWADAFTIMLHYLVRDLQGASRGTVPTFLDGLRAAEVVAAIVQSARQGAWIAVQRTPA
jgi:predicted dehydrogenase